MQWTEKLFKTKTSGLPKAGSLKEFVKLHTGMDKLRFEFKTDKDAVKLLMKDIDESLTYT